MIKNLKTEKRLSGFNSQKKYSSDAREAAFLLGGIGTGNISIGSRGNLKDIEIFNKPNKDINPPYTFFSIWVKEKGKEPVVKKIEAKLRPPYSGSSEFFSKETAGLPHLDSSMMSVQYPFVCIDFKDKDISLPITLEAFTPFIPLNANDSGIPGAIIRYKIKNNSESSVKVSVCGSMANLLGKNIFDEFGDFAGSKSRLKNELKACNILKGIYFTAEDIKRNGLAYGNMTLATTDSNVSYKLNWLQTGWFDGIQNFWNEFKTDGKLKNNIDSPDMGRQFGIQSPRVGSIASYAILKPDEVKTFEFFITWYFPNRIAGWFECDEVSCRSGENKVVKNYYTKLFSGSWDVARYLIENMNRLEKSSRDFKKALFLSTLPGYVLDALSANITALRSNTCFRIEDGKFLGWEGCFDRIGACPGSCTHVWNYAQTVAFLFPELEQSMRKVSFGLETDNNGKMNFRSINVFGKEKWQDEMSDNLLPAVDGQLGSIIRVYREWKLGGNDELIRELWPKIKLALEYAIKKWDTDGDFVLDGKKHNTYDIEFYGPEPLSNSLFFAALKAASIIAKYLDDIKASNKYLNAFYIGSKNMDEMLWNGKYYIQKIDDIDKYKYQFGSGCLSDQVLGQLFAHICGLGYILPRSHIRKAIKSVYDYNFKEDLSNHQNVQRVYALNNEAGLILCSWPDYKRPKFPFVYSDEVWTGVEYQVASHLIYEGYIKEGLNMVKAVRDRYDGYKRNPFDELECGHHYARSMASWGLLIALSGFKYDMVKDEVSFDPKTNKNNFSCFFSTGKGWGIYTQKINRRSGKLIWNIEVLYGNLKGTKINGINMK